MAEQKLSAGAPRSTRLPAARVQRRGRVDWFCVGRLPWMKPNTARRFVTKVGRVVTPQDFRRAERIETAIFQSRTTRALVPVDIVREQDTGDLVLRTSHEELHRIACDRVAEFWSKLMAQHERLAAAVERADAIARVTPMAVRDITPPPRGPGGGAPRTPKSEQALPVRAPNASAGARAWAPHVVTPDGLSGLDATTRTMPDGKRAVQIQGWHMRDGWVRGRGETIFVGESNLPRMTHALDALAIGATAQVTRAVTVKRTGDDAFTIHNARARQAVRVRRSSISQVLGMTEEVVASIAPLQRTGTDDAVGTQLATTSVVLGGTLKRSTRRAERAPCVDAHDDGQATMAFTGGHAPPPPPPKPKREPTAAQKFLAEYARRVHDKSKQRVGVNYKRDVAMVQRLLNTERNRVLKNGRTLKAAKVAAERTVYAVLDHAWATGVFDWHLANDKPPHLPVFVGKYDVLRAALERAASHGHAAADATANEIRRQVCDRFCGGYEDVPTEALRRAFTEALGDVAARREVERQREHVARLKTARTVT